MSQLADALLKSGAVSEKKYNLVEAERQEYQRLDMTFQTYYARAGLINRFLSGLQSTILLKFSKPSELEMFVALANFGTKFYYQSAVRRGVEFHLKNIYKKQKHNLDFDFKSVTGQYLGTYLNVKAEADYKRAWLVRAMGYTFLDILEGKRKYPMKFRRQIIEWVGENEKALTLNPL